MFGFRTSFPRKLSTYQSVAVSDSKLPLFEDSEKAEHATTYISRPDFRAWAKPRKLPSRVVLLLLALTVAFTWYFGQSITQYAALGYHAILKGSNALNHTTCSQNTGTDQSLFIAAAPITAPPVNAKMLTDRATWSSECSSKSDESHDCRFAIDDPKGEDGGVNTDWKSQSGGSHWIILDLKKTQKVHSLTVKASKTAERLGGSVRAHRVEVSMNKEDWQIVALGRWRDWQDVNYATFEPREARFVRLVVIDSTKDQNFVAISDVNVYVVDEIHSVGNAGRWNLTLNFPLVPVTAFINPLTLELTMLSSENPDNFGDPNGNGKAAKTFSATWNPRDNTIREDIVRVKGHDMFCPGTSLDEKGQVMVTGGVSPSAFSIYDPIAKTWSTPIDERTRNPKTIKLARGYQGQTFLSNGSTFMIGGTWSGGEGDKHGEIYDPKTSEWTVLPNIKADLIKMDIVKACEPSVNKKCVMEGWRQHHPWLFAWKQDSIFHAGPSKKMNWFFYKDKDGSFRDAGFREDKSAGFADTDAVCAIATMYDAENGAILMAGGAPNYHYYVDADHDMGPNAIHRKESTTNAFEVKLKDVNPGDIVKVKKLLPMNYQRIFANSVIFPNGEVLVVGGQKQGEPFHDETWQPVPEIYSPEKGTWRDVARHSTPRIYHSWAMLLPDASVICGGGGLSIFAASNHYDAQIYQPAYLFESDGKTLAKRPEFKAIDKKLYKIGDTMKITTVDEIDGASLIRYSAATHALNNDLRRIKLTPVRDGTTSPPKYNLAIPNDPGVTLPGYWMLFVLRKDVPSLAETVQILAS